MTRVEIHRALVQEIPKPAFSESVSVPVKQVTTQLIDRDLQDETGGLLCPKLPLPLPGWPCTAGQ